MHSESGSSDEPHFTDPPKGFEFGGICVTNLFGAWAYGNSAPACSLQTVVWGWNVT